MLPARKWWQQAAVAPTNARTVSVSCVLQPSSQLADCTCRALDSVGEGSNAPTATRLWGPRVAFVITDATFTGLKSRRDNVHTAPWCLESRYRVASIGDATSTCLEPRAMMSNAVSKVRESRFDHQKRFLRPRNPVEIKNTRLEVLRSRVRC